MSSNLKANFYGFATGCRKFYFFPEGCRKPKKVGKHCSISLLQTFLHNNNVRKVSYRLEFFNQQCLPFAKDILQLKGWFRNKQTWVELLWHGVVSFWFSCEITNFLELRNNCIALWILKMRKAALKIFCVVKVSNIWGPSPPAEMLSWQHQFCELTGVRISNHCV